MNITFFGSCSREWANRGSVSFLVEDNDSNLLIDCGPGLISGMKKSNKKMNTYQLFTITFILLCFGVFFSCIKSGRSFIWEPDGFKQHYVY